MTEYVYAPENGCPVQTDGAMAAGAMAAELAARCGREREIFSGSAGRKDTWRYTSLFPE